ncbi:MAG: PqqD family protein [Steroidobacteraceae bacterium]
MPSLKGTWPPEAQLQRRENRFPGGAVAQIQVSASYVRHGLRQKLDEQHVLRSLQHRIGFESPAAAEQIWTLLATPQTVRSLARSLAASTKLDEQRCAQEVEDVLAQLFDADLIEVSPDS